MILNINFQVKQFLRARSKVKRYIFPIENEPVFAGRFKTMRIIAFSC